MSTRSINSAQTGLVMALTACAALLAWAYWPTLQTMMQKWSTDPQYSHGYLVPIFSLGLLWYRWRQDFDLGLRASWWGIPLLMLGGLSHAAGAYLYYEWFEGVGLVLALAGVFACLGGLRALAWAWPAVAFLLFMLPLPYRLETALSHPLRRLATVGSTYLLQTAGFPAVAEGNVIYLNDITIGVIEACSGLGMLVTFFALTTAISILIRRSLPVKLVLLASAIPIALIANISRITVTSVLATIFGAELAQAFFHDFAGLFMIPLALALLLIELKIIAKLVIEGEVETQKFASLFPETVKVPS